jgi:hypothetical protein
MVLQANFVPNPFDFWQGTYNGLFSETNGVTEETAGMLKGLTVRETGWGTGMPSQKGIYSGTLLINGQRHVITGSFDLAGRATNRVLRPVIQGGSLMVQMTLSNKGVAFGWCPLVQLAGTVSGTAAGVPWVANLTAYLCGPAVGPAGIIPSAETMLIPPDANNDPPNLSPGGCGFALIANGRLTGALADGTAFSQPLAIAQGYGYCPVYASLYGNRGLLMGWINYIPPEYASTIPIMDNLTWIHPKMASGLYRNGFTNVVPNDESEPSPWCYVQGSGIPWWNSPPWNLPNIMGSMTNLWTGDIAYASGTPMPVSTSTPGEVIAASVSGTINSNSGLLTMTIGGGASKVTGRGAMVFLGANSFGAGYLLTKTNARAFWLGP